MLKFLFLPGLDGQTYFGKGNDRLLSSKLPKRNPLCHSCWEKQLIAECDLSKVSLGALVDIVLGDEAEIATVMAKGGTILWDGEDEDQVALMRPKMMEAVLSK